MVQNLKIMKSIINNIKENYKLVLGTLIVGLFLGWIFFSSSEAVINDKQITGHEEHNHASEDPTTWTCSMHPQIKQDKPGQCPICAMDLIPLASMSSEDDDVDPNEIMMSKSATELAAIQTIIVSKGIPHKTVYMQGKVYADERNIAKLTARFGGRIEKLFVNFTGQNVRKGEKLATIYSPDLVTAQRELLEALSFKESRPSLYKAAKGKLKLWDLTEKQISDIEEKGEPQFYFDVLSPISGTITMRHIAVGDYVEEGTSLFKVVDLTKVWVMFDAYESDLPWIKLGDKIDFTIQALPGKNFTAKVSYIDPFINGQTRVAKVRVEVPNNKLSLKPEMFTKGILSSKIAETGNEILIPKSAILWTGKRSVVYVKVPNRNTPSFIYREILLGPEAGNFYVIIEGLKEGEEIATNGVFKIDASAQLSGKTSMMNPAGGKVSTGHNHGGTPMSDEEMAEMEVQTTEKVNYSQETPMKFKIQLREVVNQYLQLKDSFVKSDEQTVEAVAKKTLTALKKVDMALLNGDAHMQWMKLQKPIEDNLNGIINMKGIKMKRSHFSIVSDKLLEAVDMFGLYNDETSTLYLQFCPMAFNNEGAYWLSDKKEIRNPYFGDMMLKCGEVKRTINN